MEFGPLADRLRLLAFSGPLAGETLPLVGPEMTVGRDPGSSICLADRSLSRAHCVLLRGADGWTIRDLRSANGTFVNGLRVEDQALRAGDQITVGESVFLVFLKPGGDECARVDLVAGDPGLTTGRLRPEDVQYFQPAAPPPHSRATPQIEQHLRALLAFSAAVSSIRHETELFERVLDHIIEAVPGDAAAVVLVDGHGRITEARCRQQPGTGALPISRELVAQVVSDRVGVVTRDSCVRQSGAAANPHPASLVCVPLASGGRVVGALYAATADPDGVFDDGHLQLATAFAAITSLALDNVRHFAGIARESAQMRADHSMGDRLVGKSEPMLRVRSLIEKLARSDMTTMICGESGTGKELVARALHLHSARGRGPFVAINCAALSESLLEDELFGHERGAFTTAIAQRKGKLELADGGTVFLDEVAELAPVIQGKLLRVLQEREFERVGGTRTIAVDIRVLCATNRSLAADVEAGRFRRDLFFRLNVVSIDMPPLRERGDDIATLAEHFIAHFSRKMGRVVNGMSDEALQRLKGYSWPGNVRELENAVQRAIVLGSSPTILPEDWPDSLLEVPPGPGQHTTRFHEAVLETKRRVIIDAFRKARRSYVEAARLLGLHPNYLHRVIKNLDIKGELESEL